MMAISTLRTHRVAVGLTQQQLADAVGVSPITIHHLETGKHQPRLFLALSLAKIVGVPVERIFKPIKSDKCSPTPKVHRSK